MNATITETPQLQTTTKKPFSAASPNAARTQRANPSDGGSQGKTKHIIANVNVGWGNALYVRGEGGILSWEIGTPMECLGKDRWMWTYPADQEPHQFKFLRNDRDWSTGENYSAKGTEACICTPSFE